MTRSPCKNCPFRVGSINGYDQDGMEALDSIDPPCCHEVVGAGRQFAQDATPENICKGYEAWLRNEPGFQIPYLVE